MEIYCLGLLLKLQDAGWRISWAVVTDGQAGMPAGAPKDLRRREAVAAGQTVGVEPLLLGLEDGAILGSGEEARRVREAISAFKPDVLISHAPDDYHPDHRTLSRLVAEACPPATYLLFAEPMLGGGATPDLLVDITDQYARKRAALSRHESQAAPALVPAFETWSRFRALHCGVRGAQHAEGYFVNRSISSAGAHLAFQRAIQTPTLESDLSSPAQGP